MGCAVATFALTSAFMVGFWVNDIQAAVLGRQLRALRSPCDVRTLCREQFVGNLQGTSDSLSIFVAELREYSGSFADVERHLAGQRLRWRDQRVMASEVTRSRFPLELRSYVTPRLLEEPRVRWDVTGRRYYVVWVAMGGSMWFDWRGL